VAAAWGVLSGYPKGNMNQNSESIPDPLKVVVIGAGMRGTHLARHLARLAPAVEIAGVAEPDPERRAQFVLEHGVQAGATFVGWEEFARSNLKCDAAIIATMDNQHTGPALACLQRGLHLLLEKPMADTFEDCLAIVKSQKRGSDRIISICHSLRYGEAYRLIKRIISEGQIGHLIHIEHMEAIGHFRFAHNYVRGRWARYEDNTFLLLHKCCHDLDIIQWLVQVDCRRVSSCGSLSFFRPDQAPPGGGRRCLEDCTIALECPYSALRLYVETDLKSWPARDVSLVHTREAHLEAVQQGSWGACVWHAGNNVVDHQSVLLEFEEGVTATCTLSGFSPTNGRRTRLQGTLGELLYDEATGSLTLKRFSQTAIEEYEVMPPSSYHPEDEIVVREWLSAILNPSNSRVTVDAQEALKSHALVFAAERSRNEKCVVELSDYIAMMENTVVG
jgi:predicted dehydrogenase